MTVLVFWLNTILAGAGEMRERTTQLSSLGPHFPTCTFAVVVPPTQSLCQVSVHCAVDVNTFLTYQ